jgi:hypothetical protein
LVLGLIKSYPAEADIDPARPLWIAIRARLAMLHPQGLVRRSRADKIGDAAPPDTSDTNLANARHSRDTPAS